MFQITKHAVQRLKEAAGTKGKVSIQKVIQTLDKRSIVWEGNKEYIPFGKFGLFAIKREGKLVVLTTFISVKRLGEYGSATRAYKQTA